MVKYDGQLRTYNFKKEKVKGKIYCNSIMCLDIEVTSAWYDGREIKGYEIGYDEEYWNSMEALALPYIWQFSIDGIVYYGREWNDFKQVLNDIPKDFECIIWVHNLSYEFVFLQNLITWNDIFARSPHKVMKAKCLEYPNIVFRCSYFLTRLSLATWGEQLGVLKMVGDLDYEPIRTPFTTLTDKELSYCEQDCIVLDAGIRKYVEKYGSQFKIPLTQTGTVRLEAKERLFHNRKYQYFIKNLIPRSVREYDILRQVFAGGYSHANYRHAGKTVFGHIEHFDFASSYPHVMISEKYPMAPWVYTGRHKIPPDSRFDDYAYIMRLRFHNIRSISFNTYIQKSKCIITRYDNELDNCGMYDNGRVRKAKELEIWVTEQDWITIKNNYEWDGKPEVIELYESKKEYLPRNLMNYILELYANKTTLKGVEGKEELYLQSKQYINSIFGMMVTAIVQADVTLENDEWKISRLTLSKIEEEFEKMKEPKSRRYFLSYSWGCWVTAYARRNLWMCIERCDADVIYCDTDSIFVLGHHDFSWYNKIATDKLKKACKCQMLEFDKTHPKTPKGVEKPLGIFESEVECIEFKTLGAKRYVERRTDGKLYLTVSGINKDAVEMLQDDIRTFSDGFNFDKDSLLHGKEVETYNKKTDRYEPCVKKRLSTYCINMPVVTYPDGYISAYTHGINMRRTGYRLTLTDEYKDIIQYIDEISSLATEQFEIALRGRFFYREGKSNDAVYS